MKTIFACLLFLPLYIFSQTTDTTSIPQKWKNESVVILDYSYEYYINTWGQEDYYYYDKKNEQRLKITYLVRDKWGVNELSQIILKQLNSSDFDNTIGEVQKRNGTTISLTKDNLVENKMTSELFTKGFTRSVVSAREENKTYKLAVPNLEPGDILKLDVTSRSKFVPFYLELRNEYPTLHANYNLSFKGKGDYIIESRFVNGDFTQPAPAKSITIELDTVEKIKQEILMDEEKNVPYVLLGYRYTGPQPVDKKSMYNRVPFSNLDNEGIKTVQLAFVRDMYPGDKSDKRNAKKISAALAKKHKTITDTIAYVKDAYYLYRELFLDDVMDGDLPSLYAQNLFVTTFSRLLKEKKISFKAFVTQPDYFGDFNSMNSILRTTTGIYVQGMFLFHPSMSFEPGSIPAYFENQKIYTFSINKYYKRYFYCWYFWLYPPAGLVTLPFTLPPYIVAARKAKKNRKYDWHVGLMDSEEYSQNKAEITSNIDLSKTNNEVLEINRTLKYWGKMKNYSIRRINNFYSFYNDADNQYKKLLTSSHVPVTTVPPPGLSEKKKQEEKELIKVMKSELENDYFTVRDFKGFSIEESNLFEKEKPFVYSQKFSVEDLCMHSGNILILEVGKIIGHQLMVPDDETERSNDFYIPYQRSHTNKINITIPEGYKIENLPDFNFSNVTTAGEFICTAKVNGNVLVITTTKIYKFQSLDNSKSKDIYSYLAEAEKFYNLKLILRK